MSRGKRKVNWPTVTLLLAPVFLWVGLFIGFGPIVTGLTMLGCVFILARLARS